MVFLLNQTGGGWVGALFLVRGVFGVTQAAMGTKES